MEWGTNVSVWSSFGMVLSAKAGSFCSSSRNTSRGWYTTQRLVASTASASMIDSGRGGQGVAVPKGKCAACVMSVAAITFHVVRWGVGGNHTRSAGHTRGRCGAC